MGIDENSRAIANDYIDRVNRGGSRKNVKSLSDGVWRIAINYSHGVMRVYFGKINGLLVLLGGSKHKRQSADIKKAKGYWRNYCEKKQIAQ